MASVTRWIADTLKIAVNSRNSAVDRPRNRNFPGFTVRRVGARIQVAEQAIVNLKHQIHALTRRARGRRLEQILAELKVALLGWKA